MVARKGQEGAVCAPRRLGEFFDPILFFLCQKEKNGFKLPRKERGQGAYRCPEFDSDDLSHQLSVAQVPTTRKVSALCASPFGGAASQNPSAAVCPPSSRSRAARQNSLKPNCDPVKRSQFGKEEGDCGYGVFAAPAETQCSSLLLTTWGHRPLQLNGKALQTAHQKEKTR